MKTLILTFLLIFSGYISFSQSREIDSLKHQLTILKEDKSMVLALLQLSGAMMNVSPDSGVVYAQSALELAHKINFPRGEVRSLFSLAFAHRILGDIPKSLQLVFKALQISEDNDYKSEVVWGLYMIGSVYEDGLNDHSKAIGYFLRAKQMNAAAPDEGENEFRALVLNLDIGTSYLRSNTLDSASVFLERILPDTSFLLYPVVLMYYGDLQFKLGNHQAALAYSQKAMDFFFAGKAYRSEAEAFFLRASYFRDLGQADSCIFYARKSLSKAELISYKQFMLKAATLLAETYELKNAPEALHFYKIAKLANDEVFGQKKVQELQSIILQEIERQQEVEKAKTAYRNRIRQYMLLAGLGVFLLIAFLLYRNNRQKQKANAVLENTLYNLKATQSQLIQSEKLASLGELTAGIAHEIQNPLNFVNNFSELSVDLAQEIKEEIDKVEIPQKDKAYLDELLTDLGQNQEKINLHGKRASSIVSGMLQHARTSTGKKEPTDLNALADEYLRLSYHGLRAKDSNFNAKMVTDFDPAVGKVDVIPQDMGRVLLNLINNAFYAVQQRERQRASDGVTSSYPVTMQGDKTNFENLSHLTPYEPTVTISTQKTAHQIIITVKDNGTGIPDDVKAKIFQPFFTTKPTGQGTGLGLSLAYDIVVKGHGGNLEVEMLESEGTEFVITLPKPVLI